MFNVLLARAVTVTVSASLVVIPLPARAEEIIRCESRDLGYRYCRIDTDNQVEMVHKYSLFPCRQDRSWGYDRNGVWVDRGCGADFKVGSDHRNKDKAIAAGALIGLAALIAIAANKNKQESEDVASWAVGSFTGYDASEQAQVQLTVLPGGSVTGRAGRSEFSGNLKASRLEAGRHQFQVERSGNGFIAVDERDANHRVVFQRSGSGY